ncbi:coniferyl aldehyde dehydrogenase [Halobacteriovorax sp. GB3]|uniref:coniferyl aldehyde dehydrogenase n=1 Tax=Halobacteriovorax sp. GB3 TaxID=2719615 RepID=UPI00235DCA4C|nr:coniferyl aldehyde dehydrogenase [Halobacteriovorax sp. GB3]MDD0851819.1 coniferyl aldehyde dehydrogenase [Halobacteriovorax sp. GB3]
MINNAHELQEVFSSQRDSFLKEPFPSLELRRDRLKRLKKLILENKEALTKAMSEDFNHRSEYDSLFGDILPVINNINYCLKNTKKWMKKESRHSGLSILPSRVHVHYQPKGIIGIIVPWNFPLMLSFGPLSFALAAGNRAMIKMSELSTSLTQLLEEIVPKYFTSDEVIFFGGDAPMAQALTNLPLDHLLFTGSTQVGKYVMKACSENLTPVTLELGGKSPVIVDSSVDIDFAVSRLSYGKSLNCGQICVAPDYVLVKKGQAYHFAKSYQKKIEQMYRDNPSDYTSVISPSHFDRIRNWLVQAQRDGGEVIECLESLNDERNRKMGPKLILNPSLESKVMTDEIFGPLLPIIEYESVDEAIQFVQNRPRPLACYLISNDGKVKERVLKEIHSGGVAINDTVMHVAADDAPFGGIGPSGMGHYHGREGFLTFSHAKTVLKANRFFTSTLLLHPPYGSWIQRIIAKFFLR